MRLSRIASRLKRFARGSAAPSIKPPKPKRLIVNPAAHMEGNTLSIGEGLKCLGKNTLKFSKAHGKNRVLIGNHVEFCNLKLVIKGQGHTLIIGDHVKLRGHILISGSKRTVEIGAHTTTRGINLLAREADVTIGEDCMFAREIEIRTTDVHPIFDQATGARLNPAKPVRIGHHVWVAARAFISKGADIPDGCVIGAGSFVGKALPEAHAVYAGTPARLIRSAIRWAR